MEKDTTLSLDGIIIPSINPEDEKWDNLITQIIAGNVIPVIGSNLLTDRGDINQYIIQALSNQYGIKNNPTSFSQLIYDSRCPKEVRENIHSLLNGVCTKNVFTPSLLLKRILGIKQFPFVITTSFFPIVENTMKEIHGNENVRTLIFSNDPGTTNKAGIGDISSEREMSYPTVYYMFGKHTKSKDRFVVTDIDMLRFCQSWLTQGLRPTKLSDALKTKYLLMLGNNYQDWLFRFIWYSMNQDAKNSTGMVVNEAADESLIQFLNCLQTFTQKDPNFVIDKIEQELSNRFEKEDSKFNKPQQHTDVFISYSRRESSVAKKLYDVLTQKGLNVWYDKNDLCIGRDWMDDIKDAITSTKLFIPILSNSMVDEVYEHHPYRQEWKIALEHSEGYARTFVCPLLEKGFNHMAAKASIMKHLHSGEYESTSTLEPFANEVIRQLKEII